MLCRYPLFIVAPEGTTKHRHCLLTFAKGAFATGLPVMPVLLKYRSVRFNPGWGIVYTAWHFFRVCNQYVNHLEVDVLPIYRPSAGMMPGTQLHSAWVLDDSNKKVEMQSWFQYVAVLATLVVPTQRTHS